MKLKINTYFTLLIGFSLLLSLIIGLTVTGALRMQHISNHLNDVVEVEYAKVQHTYVMLNASRERILRLHVMLLTDDPFKRDENYLIFLDYAAQFIQARTAYRALNLDEEEKLLLEEINHQSQRSYAAQEQTLELLLNTQREEAQYYLTTYAMPAQAALQKILLVLLTRQRSLASTLMAEATQSAARSYYIILILGSTTLVCGIGIAWLVMRQISKVQRMSAHAQQQTQDAAYVKNTFLANMSHEIRTPLNAIIGMSELLSNAELNAVQRDYVEIIHTSSGTLLTVINDILDFSQIEAGMLHLEEEAFDLRAIIETSFDLLAAQSTAKGVDLMYVLDSNVNPGCMGDARCVQKILLHLLNNAITSTSQGEVIVRIQLMTPATNGIRRLHFSVQDSGVGIAPEQLEHLFRPFTEVHAKSRSVDSTGLGLAICKRLCERMGGDIWVESTLNSGSTFSFIINMPSVVLPDAFVELDNTMLMGKRVLLVEDNDVVRGILRTQLQAWGLDTDTFARGATAISSLWRGANYDLVLIDQELPGMDSEQLIAKVRTHTLHTVPILFMSPRQENDTPLPEASYRVSKPIKPGQLHAKLLEACGAVNAAQHSHFSDEEYAELGWHCPLQILLAEDNLVNQKVARLMLQKLDYQTDIAHNGAEVLTALQHFEYDLILMDIQMPVMDGIEATRRIHSEWNEDRGPKPLIIAMTASVLEQDVENCREAGMNGHLGKPVELAALAHVLRDAYSQRYPHAPPKTRPHAVIHLENFNKMLALVGGDPLTLKSVIDHYLQDAPKLLQALHEAVSRHDEKALLDAITPLRSSSYSLGALTLANLCAELEQAAGNGLLQGSSDKLTKIQQELAQVLECLPKMLGGRRK